MAKIFSKETSPTTQSSEDIRILTMTAYKQSTAKLMSCTAFADGGADQNVIFKEISDRLGLKMDSSERPIIRVLGAGNVTQALGKVQLSFRLGGWREYDNVSFLVLPHQEDFDVLLGWPFLHQEMGMGFQTSHRRRVEKLASWLRCV